ncbi:MAG: hypothetical protein ACRDTG_10710 [Pseudonocardiaceae bacterium]
MTATSRFRHAALRGLLDDGLLTGQHEVTTVLRPERVARPVAVDDLPAMLVEIEQACQVWGGAGQPFLPVRDGRLPEPYTELLRTEQVDFVGGLQAIEVALPSRVKARQPWNHPAILVGAHEPRDRWRTVRVVELDSDDPWRPIYDVVLGKWPETPDPGLSQFVGLREDLRFEEIAPIERVSTTGSLEDLVERLVDREFMTPRIVSNIFMSYGLRPDASFRGAGEEVLPRPGMTRRAAGPNLIVAMTPGSVEDIALLWNLRGAHGGGRTMPIGVPADKISAEVLRELQRPGRATMFGWGGGTCHLVSASVPINDLKELAAESPTVQAVTYDTVLTFGPAPGRLRSHVSTWRDGRTRLDPMSETDHEILRKSRTTLRSPKLILDVTVDDRPLPVDGTMRGSEFLGRFQGGAAQVAVSELRERETVEVFWPSSWTCLAAVAQSRGLDVRESEPGLAAATLIRALGDIDMIRFLRHRPLIALLHRMAERSGMAWWKKRWADAHRELLAAGADPTTLDKTAVVLGRDDPAVAPAGEGRAVTFQEFVTALRSEPAARHWVAWAERGHLLVRGADITCPDCKTGSWLPMAALPPPVPCLGCGRQIDQPYGPRELKFTYRLGEPLRRVLETDSLGHVLTLYWFVQLFDRAGLVGAHPGVTFTDPTDSGTTIGEADVLLLFADGDLVPVEVKRRLAGVDDRTARLMDTLADALDAPWDALAVTEPAREIPSLTDAERMLPDRPRVILTDDQLHEEHVRWTMGRNPFCWEPRTTEQDTERETAFVKWLATNDPDVPWDHLQDALLDSGSKRRSGPVDLPQGPSGAAVSGLNGARQPKPPPATPPVRNPCP